MRSRQFDTFDDAIKYLEERGELKYFGRIGNRNEICPYSFVHKGIKYSLNVHLDGLVQIREE